MRAWALMGGCVCVRVCVRVCVCAVLLQGTNYLLTSSLILLTTDCKFLIYTIILQWCPVFISSLLSRLRGDKHIFFYLFFSPLLFPLLLVLGGGE